MTKIFGRLAARREDRQNFLQPLTDVLQIGRRVGWKGQRHLGFVGFAFITQLLPSAGDGVSLFIEQTLDTHHAFHIALAVHALSGAALNALELRKFGFPEAENIGWQPAQSGDFADAEIELFRNQDFARFARFAVLLFRSHRRVREETPLHRKARIPVSAVSSTMRACEQPPIRAIGILFGGMCVVWSSVGSRMVSRKFFSGPRRGLSHQRVVVIAKSLQSRKELAVS